MKAVIAAVFCGHESMSWFLGARSRLEKADGIGTEQSAGCDNQRQPAGWAAWLLRIEQMLGLV
jgi:hypothetical protein